MHPSSVGGSAWSATVSAGPEHGFALVFRTLGSESRGSQQFLHRPSSVPAKALLLHCANFIAGHGFSVRVTIQRSHQSCPSDGSSSHLEFPDGWTEAAFVTHSTMGAVHRLASIAPEHATLSYRLSEVLKCRNERKSELLKMHQALMSVLVQNPNSPLRVGARLGTDSNV